MSEPTELTTLNGAMRLNYDLLFPSPTNPRRHFEEGPLKELSENIREHGVLMPLMVRRVEARNSYEVVAGERRFRALGMALAELAANAEEARYQELYTVPVIVRELTDGQVLALQLVENIQRKDLTPLEEAEGYQRLLDLKGEETFTPAMIAQRIGIHVQTVLFKLNMLRAPKFMRDALEAGQCSERHLVIVATIPREESRVKAAKQILAGDRWNKPLTVRDASVLINDEYRRSLKGVLFSLDDAALLPEAGACSACPHFAKKAAEMDSELAKELGNGRGELEPLTCLLPSCYKSKMDALLKQKQAQAKQQAVELRVLKKDETEKVFNNTGSAECSLKYNSGMVKLDAKLGSEIYGHYNEEKMVTWREVTEGLLPVGSVMVAKMDDGSIVEIVDAKVAKAAAKEHKKHGKLFVKEEKQKVTLSVSEKKKKEREAFNNKVALRSKICVLQHLYERGMEKGMDAEASLAVLDCVLHEAGMDGNRQICLWLKLEPTPAKKGSSLDQGNYRAAILQRLRDFGAGKPEVDAMIMIAAVAKWVKCYGLNISSLEPLTKHFGFDKKTITALATAEVQAEIAAKEAKKKPKTKSKSGKPDADHENLAAQEERGRREILEQGDEERKKAPSRKVGAGMFGVGPIMEVAMKGMPTVTGKRSRLGMWPVDGFSDGDDHYYHCDCCGKVCATDELAADVAALPEGEFRCYECPNPTLLGGGDFIPLPNQDLFETWVPGEKSKVSKNQRAGETEEEFREREAKRIAACKLARKAKKPAEKAA